jgi:hypothetical protein
VTVVSTAARGQHRIMAWPIQELHFQDSRVKHPKAFLWAIGRFLLEEDCEIYFWRMAVLAIRRNIPPNTSSWSG